MARDEEIIAFVVKRHGPIINVEQNPEILIDIIRRFREDDGPPDGGQPCGGVPSPPPPPSPSLVAEGVTLNDLMKQLLTLTREISSIKEQLGIRE